MRDSCFSSSSWQKSEFSEFESATLVFTKITFLKHNFVMIKFFNIFCIMFSHLDLLMRMKLGGKYYLVIKHKDQLYQSLAQLIFLFLESDFQHRQL